MWECQPQICSAQIKDQTEQLVAEKPQRTWHTLRADEVRFMGGNQIDMRIDGAATF